jgi:hypothetical protein
MTKGIKYLIASVLFAATAASAPAQFDHRAELNVPFSFAAAGRTYPAGHYTVTLDHQTGQAMLSSWPNSAVLMTTSEDKISSWDSYLKFQRYGDMWVLREVNVSGAIRLVNPGKLEGELAKAKPAEKKIFAAKIK